MSECIDTEIGRIPIDAEIKDLGECISLIIDHRGKTPKKLGSDWVEKGIPAISAKNVHGGKLDNRDSIRYVTHEVYKKWMKDDVKRGDCFLVSEGATLGEFLFWDNDYPIVLSQRLFCIRTNPEILYNRYFYAYMNTSNFQKQVQGRATGSSVDGLRQTEVLQLQIPIIPFERQVLIGDLLYNLERKKKDLSEQNQTLEELAQTLFKRWFVDFEFPNETGQPYKSSGGKMVESELGEIPEGWRVGEVSDFVRHSTKSISPNKEPSKIFSHYSIPAFDSGRYPTKDLGETILSNKYIVLENSILVSKLNPSTSRIWTVFKPCTNGICSTEIQVFVPNKNSYAFSFGLFHYSGIKREMAQRASGTSSSHQRVRPGDILNIEFVIPKEEILIRFEESVLATLKKVEENQEEIQTLTQLRDTLLPKLMSGELTINQEALKNV